MVCYLLFVSLGNVDSIFVVLRWRCFILVFFVFVFLLAGLCYFWMFCLGSGKVLAFVVVWSEFVSLVDYVFLYCGFWRFVDIVVYEIVCIVVFD